MHVYGMWNSFGVVFVIEVVNFMLRHQIMPVIQLVIFNYFMMSCPILFMFFVRWLDA